MELIVQDTFKTTVLCITRINGNCSQTAATIKRPIPDARDTAAYHDTRQTAATIKRRAPDAGDAVGYRESSGFPLWTFNQRSLGLVVQDILETTVICITRINGYCIQTATTIKRPVTDTGDTPAYHYTRQASATRKRIRHNARDAARDCESAGFTYWAYKQRSLELIVQDTFKTTVICITRINGYCSQTTATIKRIFSDARDTAAYRYTR